MECILQKQIKESRSTKEGAEGKRPIGMLVHFVHHAESEHKIRNPDGTITVHENIPVPLLTEKGKKACLDNSNPYKKYLGDNVKLFTSPQARAMMTAYFTFLPYINDGHKAHLLPALVSYELKVPAKDSSAAIGANWKESQINRGDWVNVDEMMQDVHTREEFFASFFPEQYKDGQQDVVLVTHSSVMGNIAYKGVKEHYDYSKELHTFWWDPTAGTGLIPMSETNVVAYWKDPMRNFSPAHGGFI